MATYVRTMQRTPLWGEWDIRHVATHRDGSVATRVIVFLGGATAFVRELLLHRPAVVHLHTASYGSFARKSLLAWAARGARVPVVLHVHGGAFRDFYRAAPWLVRRYVRATLQMADAVVALGETWQRMLQEISPGARVVVIPNAVRPGAPVEQPGPGETVRVLFLGSIHEAKGAFLLLDAWRRLGDARRGPPADLVMAGNGAVDEARAKVADLGLADQVRVTGWVPQRQVETLLRGSHVLVLPSFAEGQPMALLEAMAQGLCVVASSVGGIPDLIDGECGVLVPPGDGDALVAALCTVLADPELRSRLGGRALDRVRERFDVDRVWRAIDGLYEDVTA
ncbi:glycosyltransferase family 4 protein [Trujillonella endophytica]|uniref:glycosyltransferase family 4 protein n=1 Tax=Trujillonella endophytica TaxID=673521 RepID=UPI001B8D23AD|nr:glycosyltransferase family 4 protein [Trujillella endophytica]